jgi:hypothetical protein
MNRNIKFYKIKIIKEILTKFNQVRTQLLDELAVNATDSTIVQRRIRMLKHVNLYENQLISKVQNFKTNDINDLNTFNVDYYIGEITNRSA